MRYSKGSIQVDPTYDDAILRNVLRCGFISSEQIQRSMELDGHALPRRSLNWRLQRLVDHQLIRLQRNVVSGATRVFSIDRWGVAHLAGRGEYCLGVCDSLETADEMAVLHALDLNDIRLALKESGALLEWRSELEIRSRNEFTTFGYAKDYDAIVTVTINNREHELALEYERTAKAAKRYKEIRAAVESERMVRQFLYLAANYHLLNFLTQFFERSRRSVYFGLVDDFRRDQLNMKVIDCTRTRSERLSVVLQGGWHS